LTVIREFQLRLHQAFHQAGVSIALPQQEVRFKSRARPGYHGSFPEG
jgi:small-conductance mechanosensitive channel